MAQSNIAKRSDNVRYDRDLHGTMMNALDGVGGGGAHGNKDCSRNDFDSVVHSCSF
jgi:hypothetical protein